MWSNASNSFTSPTIAVPFLNETFTCEFCAPTAREMDTISKNNTDNAVYNAKVMEQCAKMAFVAFSVNPNLTMNPLLVEKHYMRKHGPNAYYGQKGQKH